MNIIRKTDANWRPASGPDVARRRAAMLDATRDFFAHRNVLEVSTPVLTRHAVTDANIDSVDAVNGAERLFLRTSPEYHMKRLLAAGYPDIYQVGPVFRAGEQGHHHVPEFTMIEWYRRDFDLDGIVDETLCLVQRLLDAKPETFVTGYADAFRDALDIDILECPTAALEAAAGADPQLAATLGNDRNAWLDLLLATRVTSTFPAGRLTVLRHYPASQAALARLCPDDPRVADRFEVFLGDVELANGFVELADAGEQLARFRSDQALRRAAGKPVPEIDTQLLGALEAGLPDCAGVALGFDRLLLCALNVDDISRVTTFAPGQ